ncbi:aldo/keto reductase, partial [Klebsiella pneumoniae]|uniref:aldo/keto reductase n=1 Tax=Klebsiella pneumoniae TaxID=573 RepID=UPI0023B1AFE1
GYLTGKYRSAADFGKSVRGGRMQAFMDGTGPAVLDAMDAIAEETGASLAQIALAWLAAQPGVTAPIARATSVAQVEEVIGAMD